MRRSSRPPTRRSPRFRAALPTALTVVRNGGVITSLSFAASCTITGTPVLVPDLFGPGQDGYVIADRLFTPAELLATNDGLAALIGTAADTGGTFSVTFDIDLSTGVPSGFTAQTTLVGLVIMLDGGDVQVGAATLPASVVDDEARAELETAAELGVETTVVVDGVGTIDQAIRRPAGRHHPDGHLHCASTKYPRAVPGAIATAEHGPRRHRAIVSPCRRVRRRTLP